MAIQLTLFTETQALHSLPKGGYFHPIELSVSWTWSQTLDIIKLSHCLPRGLWTFLSVFHFFMVDKDVSILCLLAYCQVENSNGICKAFILAKKISHMLVQMTLTVFHEVIQLILAHGLDEDMEHRK